MVQPSSKHGFAGKDHNNNLLSVFMAFVNENELVRPQRVCRIFKNAQVTDDDRGTPFMFGCTKVREEPYFAGS